MLGARLRNHPPGKRPDSAEAADSDRLAGTLALTDAQRAAAGRLRARSTAAQPSPGARHPGDDRGRASRHRCTGSLLDGKGFHDWWVRRAAPLLAGAVTEIHASSRLAVSADPDLGWLTRPRSCIARWSSSSTAAGSTLLSAPSRLYAATRQPRI